jgi:hypothetical protein
MYFYMKLTTIAGFAIPKKSFCQKFLVTFTSLLILLLLQTLAMLLYGLEVNLKTLNLCAFVFSMTGFVSTAFEWSRRNVSVPVSVHCSRTFV